MVTYPSNYDPAAIAKVNAALKKNPTLAASLKDPTWLKANPQALNNLKNFLTTGQVAGRTPTPTTSIESLPWNNTNIPPTPAQAARESNNATSLNQSSQDAIQDEMNVITNKADANSKIVEAWIKPLEDLYNSQTDDFKWKFAAQWATIAKQEAVGEKRLSELDAEIRGSNTNNIDRLARREAWQTAIASSSLSAKGLSDQFVRNVASEVWDKFEDSRLKAQTEYITNLNTLAKSYQELYQQLYENRSQLTRDEFEFAKVVASRVSDISKKREEAQKEYLKVYDSQLTATKTRVTTATEKDTADHKRELDKKRWDEADDTVKRQMLFDSFIKAEIKAGEVTSEEVTEALTKWNIDDALNWLAERRRILNPQTGIRVGSNAGSTPAGWRATGATSSTNWTVNPLEDTYNAYIGNVKGTAFEQDFINAYKANDRDALQKAYLAANAAKNNNTSTGAWTWVDVNAIKGLAIKIKSLSPGAKAILFKWGITDDLKLLNNPVASNADKTAAFERVKRAYALMVKQSPETQQLEKDEWVGRERTRRQSFINSNDLSQAEQNALQSMSPGKYARYIKLKKDYLNGLHLWTMHDFWIKQIMAEYRRTL